MPKEKTTQRPKRRDTGLRLAAPPPARRLSIEAIDPRDGFPWRGLATGLVCWLAIGLVVAVL